MGPEQPMLDTAKTQINTQSEKIPAESKAIKPQHETSTPLSETQPSTIESSITKDFSAVQTGNEIPEVEGKVVAPSEKVVNTSDKSRAGSTETVVETNRIMVPGQTDTPAAEVQVLTNAAALTTELSTNNEADIALDRSTTQQDTTQKTPLRSEDADLSNQTASNQREVVSESRSIEPEVETFEVVKTPLLNFDVQADGIVTNQTNTEIGHPTVPLVTRMEVPEAPTPGFQSVESTSQTIETKNAGQWFDAHLNRPTSKIETQQANSIDPAVRKELSQTDKDNIVTEIPPRVPVTKELKHFEVANPQAVQSEFENVADWNVEQQIKVNMPVEGTSKIDLDSNMKTNLESTMTAGLLVKNMPSVDPVEKFTNARTTVADETEGITNQEPLTLTDNSQTGASQPNISVKVEAGKQIFKNKPTASKDEEILPAQKQPKLNRTSEFAAASIGPVKEAMVVEGSGKVAVSEINPQAVEVMQQVIRQMNGKLKSGPASMHLQLNPKELGTIDVEMVSTSQGVSVTFFAEQPNTGKLLETQLNQLRESLIDSGVQLSGLNINQHGPSGQKGGFAHDTNFAQYPPHDIPRNEPDITEISQAERVRKELGEVDYLI